MRRVHHTRKSGRDLIEGGEAPRARSELDGALEERRNELLIARQESGEGRVHPSKLVLQVCADMLLSVSREVGSREWDEVRELAISGNLGQSRAISGHLGYSGTARTLVRGLATLSACKVTASSRP